MTYAEKLKSPKWQRRKAQVCERAGWKCEECGEEVAQLQVHHVFYLSAKDPWEYPDCLLICLCEQCHKDRQSVEQDLYVNIASIIRYNSIAEIKAMPAFQFIGHSAK